MKKQTSTLAGIVIIIAIAVIAFGGVFVYENFANKTPSVIQTQNTTTQISTNRTTGWQTYTDVQHGFLFQYPQGTKINNTTDVIFNDITLGSINRGKKIIFQIDSSRFLAVEVLTQDPNCPDTAAAGDLPNKTIGGIDFMGVAGHQIAYDIKNDDYPPYVNANEYCAVINGLEYKIIPAILDVNGNEGPLETDSLLNQIMATFKFTN